MDGASQITCKFGVTEIVSKFSNALKFLSNN